MIERRPSVQVDEASVRNARPGDRARIERALESASPAATAVPARALLLIRHLRVETPLGRGDGARFAAELVDRVRAAKVGAGRGAPNSAGDVYFEDDVALEIALVRAWLGGAPLPAVLRDALPDGATPVLRWRKRIFGDGQLSPRLIVALADEGLASAWFDRFDDHELVAAADTILRAHGAPFAGVETRLKLGRSVASRGRVPPSAIPAAIAEAMTIARRFADRPAARRLIAIALVAARRPELVADDNLQVALAALPTATPAPSRRGLQAEQVRVDTNPRPGAEPSEPARPAPVVDDRAPDAPRGRSARRIAPVPPLAAATPALPAEAPLGPAPSMRPIDSGFAGMFFLLNVFVALGLYGNAVDPAGRVRGLSPFALLLLLGRRWFGDGFLTDPIARVLRDLAGLAPHERIAQDFTAPAWKAPARWLAPWPRTRARIVERAAGTTRWHPAGFPIADRWRVARSPAWLRRRWVACLASYLEARLTRALGVADKTAALRIVARAHGRITIDGDALEIAFTLDDHPLSLRLAGLDRDPGWIPAAGRSIRFRFA
ncbi:hypothetical protein M0208_11475 [Sphingomonas sp. SUN019]|uniref:hypothetical protein n=1 Tax=Sphingomonas sp. SUN019 TaxID=2937788 RepID=UPI00216496EF|nr:hypothetical protein [Sphingomonas sp. SUN019]UVO51109.1 hypothetical protein M0208_11475 [Sphingomonas sp. SUN019]